MRFCNTKNFFACILVMILLFPSSSHVSANSIAIDDEIKNQIKEIAKQIFQNKNNAVLTSDLELIDSIYDRKTKYGNWAYEHEQSKVNYLHKWEEKQGIKFIEITPTVVVKRITGGPSSFNVSLLCSTEYKYIYENLPDSVNAFRIGTYHELRLTDQNGAWIITKEWYTDPFADSKHNSKLMNDDLKQFALNQNSRDFSTLKQRRLNAVTYADQYCGAASEEQYGFKYNKKYRNYNPLGGDCANFASQILHEGGKFRQNKAWGYDSGGATRSWVNADGFKNYMIRSGRASLIAYGTYEKVFKNSYKLIPGDFVAYEKKGDITHISVVTGADSRGYSLVSCHNTDRLKVPWDLGWSDKGIKFHLIRVHF